jgi:hypothetical protein
MVNTAELLRTKRELIRGEKKVSKSDVAREYRAKWGVDMPTRQLSRLMYNDNKSLFKDLEDARYALKYIEGKLGAKKKAHLGKSAEKTEFIMEAHRPLNPYQMPKSDSPERKVFTLPTGCNRIGFISDLQVPFHDVQAIEATCNWLHTKGINTLFINGDLADFYQMSNFIRDPRKRKFSEEIQSIKEILQWLRGEFPLVQIYYNLDANHERRYERYMMTKAPELLQIKEFDIEDLFGLNDYGIKPLRGYDHIMIGKLPVVHGDTIFRGFGSPVSKARTVFLKTKHSCIASHVHQTDEYNTKDIHGKLFTCWTTGCLMSLNVEYNPHGNEYNHGFAYIETERDGEFRVENKRILNGKVL